MSRIKFISVMILLFAFVLSACQATGTTGNNTNGTAPTNPPATTGGDTTGAVAACANTDAAQLVQAGKDVYSTRCASCHGEQGEGQGNFPALMNNSQITAQDAATMVQKMMDPSVHPFITDITNTDVASVLSYVRSSFGGGASAVCPEIIDALRPPQ
jgi:mono/diheme cytochrome c family protein